MIGLITSLFTEGFEYFKRKQEEKQKAQEREQQLKQAKVEAQIKRLQSGDESATKIDELSMKHRGWKDECLFILTILPLGLSFVPDWAYIVDEGFAALSNVPEYYWYALGMIYIDTFGFRRMIRSVFEYWLQKRFGGING